MKIKSKLLLCNFLMLTSIISVGFSSWIIMSDPIVMKSINGFFRVEDVFNSNDYVSISDEVVVFEYFDTGFIDGDTTSLTGKLEFKVVVHVNECKKLFSTYNLKLTTTLSYSDDVTTDLEIFYDYLKDVKVNNETADFFLGDKLPVYTNVDVSGDTDLVYLYSFTFTASSLDDYKNNLFPYLVDDKISFKVEAKLSET